MRRTILVLSLLAAALAVGQWLAQRPPAWLDQDPLQHPFGRGRFDPAAEDSASVAAIQVQFPLDLNTASAPDLRHLPGVGPVLADRIVASRELAGLFAKPSDLTRVKGIGPKTLDRILPLIRCAPAVADSLANR